MYGSSDYSKHLNTYVHKILELIKQYDRPISFQEVEQKTGINIMSNAPLIRSLKSNSKIMLTHESIKFLPSFNIRSVEDLRELLKSKDGKEGIEMKLLSDSPVDVLPFVKEMLLSGEIIILKDMDSSEIAFYNDLNVKPTRSDIVELWHSIKVPNHQDINQELNDAGLKNADLQTLKKRKVVKLSKPKKNKRRITITNTHVAGLDLNNMDDDDD